MNKPFDRVISSLDEFVSLQTAEDNFSGSYLLAEDYRILTEKSVGFANKKLNKLNTFSTAFNLGSLTKMFTAVAIAQLTEQKRLNFTDKVGEILPSFPNEEVKEKVTIHHLLSHTSGLGHYLADKEKFLKHRKNLSSVKQFVEFFQNEPLRFEPGTKYEYSGNGYELLGRIIEEITGGDYFEYIGKNIFKRAEMQNSGFFKVDPEDSNSNVAIGYTNRADDGETIREGERRENTFMNLIRGGAGGGSYSSTHDLLNFSQALFSNKLISENMRVKLTTPKVEIGTKNGQTLYYGYGFQILDVGNGNLRIGHGGSFAGASARFDIYPWLNTTAVVLSNYDEPCAHKVANKACDLLLQD